SRSGSDERGRTPCPSRAGPLGRVRALWPGAGGGGGDLAGAGLWPGGLGRRGPLRPGGRPGMGGRGAPSTVLAFRAGGGLRRARRAERARAHAEGESGVDAWITAKDREDVKRQEI